MTTLSDERIYTVSRLTREARTLLEMSFPLIWVEGEISNLARPASGHLYFSLKDESAQVRCAFFRNQTRRSGVDAKDGMHVLIRAKASLYEGRGDFQLIVEHMEDIGEGALRRKFEQTKMLLSNEGLFDTSRKKVLPRFPIRLGIVTSPSGSVIHDIIITLKRRYPALPVVLYPSSVQGSGALEELVKCIELANIRKECDVLILARGGGSLEDMQAFNEERLARTIAASHLPIVCGVGHETDFTIADLVADVRAPTPTAAAELVSPDKSEIMSRLDEIEARLFSRFTGQRLSLTQKTDWLSRRLLHPKKRIADTRERFIRVQLQMGRALIHSLSRKHSEYRHPSSRLMHYSPKRIIDRFHLQLLQHKKYMHKQMRHRLFHSHARLENVARQLNNLNPLAVLERGYSITYNNSDKSVVTSIRQVETKKAVDIRVKDGVITAKVEKIEKI